MSALPDAIGNPRHFQEWLTGLLEEHRDTIIEDVRNELSDLSGPQPIVTKMVSTGSSALKEALQKRLRGTGEEEDSKKTRRGAARRPSLANGHAMKPAISHTTSRVQTSSSTQVVRKSETALCAPGEEIEASERQEKGGEDVQTPPLSPQSNRDSFRMGKKASDHTMQSTLSRKGSKEMARHLDQEMTGQNLMDNFIGGVIVSNTIVMLVELEWAGHVARVTLGLQEEDGSWDHANAVFGVLEHIFNAIFLAEMIVRLYTTRHKYFYEAWNWMDFGLVVVTSLQLYILEPLFGNAGAKRLTLFRMSRFGRAIRVVRVIRLLRFFTELRILVSTFVASIRGLVWSMVFLFLSIIMGALFISFALKDAIVEDGFPHTFRVWMYMNYGSAARSIYTLFEVTMSGCWPTYLRPLVERVSWWYAIFIIVYVSVVVFAATRIITALLLKETLQAAAYDMESQARDQRRTKTRYLSKLRKLFAAMDESGDGLLSFDEIHAGLQNSSAKSYLKMLDLQVEDIESLFVLLDTDGTGEISFEEFITGIHRLKGQARAMDVIHLMRAADMMQVDVAQLHKENEQLYRIAQALPRRIADEMTPVVHEMSQELHLASKVGALTNDRESNDKSNRFDL